VLFNRCQVIQCNLFGVTTVPTRYCTRRHKYILLAQGIGTERIRQEQSVYSRSFKTDNAHRTAVCSVLWLQRDIGSL